MASANGKGRLPLSKIAKYDPQRDNGNQNTNRVKYPGHKGKVKKHKS